MTVFSISEKMFLKIESLMCVLRTHINRIQNILVQQLYFNILFMVKKSNGKEGKETRKKKL